MFGGDVSASEYDLGEFAIGIALVLFIARWTVIYEGWFFGVPTEFVPFRWEPLVSMLLMFAVGLLVIDLNPSIDHERRYRLDRPVVACCLGIALLLLGWITVQFLGRGLGVLLVGIDTVEAASGSTALATVATLGVVIGLAAVSAIALYVVVGVIVGAMFGYLTFGWLVFGDYGHGPVVVFISLVAGFVVLLPLLTIVSEALILALGLGGLVFPSVESRIDDWRTPAPE